MNDLSIILTIGQHQAAFREDHGNFPAIIHVHPFLIEALADSPWFVHFDKDRYAKAGEGYLAHSRLIPTPELPMSVMWSPMDKVPDWSGEH